MRIAQRHARVRRAISLTPLIDVVFILLIFFMLASSFLDWRSVELQLPAEGDAGTADQLVIVIGIAESGALLVNGEPMRDEQLAAGLVRPLADDAALPVIVVAAEGAPLQRSVEVAEIITQAGGQNVSLTYDKREAP